jgi:hypothetical protein
MSINVATPTVRTDGDPYSLTPGSQTPTVRVDQSAESSLSRLQAHDGTINNNDHVPLIRRRRSNNIVTYHMGQSKLFRVPSRIYLLHGCNRVCP